jgi:hypothetical protein
MRSGKAGSGSCSSPPMAKCSRCWARTLRVRAMLEGAASQRRCLPAALPPSCLASTVSSPQPTDQAAVPPRPLPRTPPPAAAGRRGAGRYPSLCACSHCITHRPSRSTRPWPASCLVHWQPSAPIRRRQRHPDLVIGVSASAAAYCEAVTVIGGGRLRPRAPHSTLDRPRPAPPMTPDPLTPVLFSRPSLHAPAGRGLLNQAWLGCHHEATGLPARRA